MASPQKENGYTAIANEILEAFCKYKFPAKSSIPSRIVLFVIRKTYGFHKKKDVISITQFQEGIGEKNRSNLIHWLKYLVQAKILVKDKISNMQVEYGLNKNYDEWIEVVQAKQLVQARLWSSASNDTKTSASNRTYKRKKDNTKDNASTRSVLGVEIKEFNLKEEIEKLMENPRRELRIIGWFISEKRVSLKNKEQFQTTLRRHLRAAKLLVPFEVGQLKNAADNADRQIGNKWTLETLYKLLTK